MPSESEYQRHWDELLEEKAREALRNRGKIPVTSEVRIEFDRNDTWFLIEDADNLNYDMPGAIILGLDDLDPLIDALVQLRSLKYYAGKHRSYPVKQWKDWECRLMGWLDFRYWFCDCHYQAPYGRVISADCKRHD